MAFCNQYRTIRMIKNIIKIQCKVKKLLIFDLSTRTNVLPMESALETSHQGTMAGALLLSSSRKIRTK